MFREVELPGGSCAIVVVRQKTVDRLKPKCFRGGAVVRAGNFLRWTSVEGVLSDSVVQTEFLNDIEVLWEKQDLGTHSLCVTHDIDVGWESTGALAEYDYGVLERFVLNRRSSAMRVLRDCQNIKAPKTKQLTIVFELKSEDEVPVAVVHSMYPGVDVGELNGDVTEREKRVFFDWSHPGEK